MKKEYMKPEVELMAMDTINGLLFGSSVGDDLSGGGDMGDFPGGSIDAPALSPEDLLGIPGVPGVLGM